ncbi:hypothetical protein VTK26DRAFT_6794 [Humicola hyalothermophila]
MTVHLLCDSGSHSPTWPCRNGLRCQQFVLWKARGCICGVGSEKRGGTAESRSVPSAKLEGPPRGGLRGTPPPESHGLHTSNTQPSCRYALQRLASFKDLPSDRHCCTNGANRRQAHHGSRWIWNPLVLQSTLLFTRYLTVHSIWADLVPPD